MFEWLQQLVNNMSLIAAVISALATIAPFIVVFHYKVIKPLLKAIRKFPETVNLVEKINKELQPNGGNSIRDIVNKIEKKTETIEYQNILQLAKMQAFLQDDERGIFETDKEGRCVWVNLGYQRITGRALEEIIENNWVNNIAPEDKENVIREWNLAMKDHRPFQMTYSFIKPNGEKVKIRCNTIHLKNSLLQNNEILGILGFITVIK